MGERMKRKAAEIGRRIERDLRQYGVGLLAVLLLYFLCHGLFGAFCPSVLVSGFPCPGCGMTRAVLYLFRGQFARSWALNPAAGLWVLWALLWAYNRYIKGRRSKILQRAFWGILAFMLIAYIVRMVHYFPDRPPYVYRRDNLFARILPGYDKVVRYRFLK